MVMAANERYSATRGGKCSESPSLTDRRRGLGPGGEDRTSQPETKEGEKGNAESCLVSRVT